MTREPNQVAHPCPLIVFRYGRVRYGATTGWNNAVIYVDNLTCGQSTPGESLRRRNTVALRNLAQHIRWPTAGYRNRAMTAGGFSPQTPIGRSAALTGFCRSTFRDCGTFLAIQAAKLVHFERFDPLGFPAPDVLCPGIRPPKFVRRTLDASLDSIVVSALSCRKAHQRRRLGSCRLPQCGDRLSPRHHPFSSGTGSSQCRGKFVRDFGRTA